MVGSKSTIEPIVIDDEATWPTDVSQFIGARWPEFVGWECDCCQSGSSSSYDMLVAQFRTILRPYSLQGFHCTRLSEYEVNLVRTSGLKLLNRDFLCERIDRLVADSTISAEVAEKLKFKNLAGDSKREGRLWFCFYEPHLAGEVGINSFFRFWGGEALYKSHENDPFGNVLTQIGTPCVIKARVPISFLASAKYPDSAMVRKALVERGHILRIPLGHDGYVIKKLLPEMVLEIAKYPSKNFIKLTGCNAWQNSIDVAKQTEKSCP